MFGPIAFFELLQDLLPPLEIADHRTGYHRWRMPKLGRCSAHFAPSAHMLLAHPATRLSTCPEPSPTEGRDSPAGALGAASSLAALSYTAALSGVAGRVRCRSSPPPPPIVTASAALTVDAASAFAAAVIVRLGHHRLGSDGRLSRCTRQPDSTQLHLSGHHCLRGAVLRGGRQALLALLGPQLPGQLRRQHPNPTCGQLDCWRLHAQHNRIQHSRWGRVRLLRPRQKKALVWLFQL